MNGMTCSVCLQKLPQIEIEQHSFSVVYGNKVVCVQCKAEILKGESAKYDAGQFELAERAAQNEMKMSDRLNEATQLIATAIHNAKQPQSLDWLARAKRWIQS